MARTRKWVTPSALAITLVGLVYLAVKPACQSRGYRDPDTTYDLWDELDGRADLTVQNEWTSREIVLEAGSDIHARVFDILKVGYVPKHARNTERVIGGTLAYVLRQGGRPRVQVHWSGYVEVTTPAGEWEVGLVRPKKDVLHELKTTLGFSEP
jgi:hypothetical protein